MRLRPMNLTDEQRALRIAVGWIALIAGVVLLAAELDSMQILPGALVTVAGIAVFLTGYLGRCPIARRLRRPSRRTDADRTTMPDLHRPNRRRLGDRRSAAQPRTRRRPNGRSPHPSRRRHSPRGLP